MTDYFAISAHRPETRILACISGLWTSRLVGFASAAGLFEALQGEGLTAAQLANQKGLHADALARALEGLVHLGLLDRRAGRFVLAEGMEPLATGGLRDMAALWSLLFDGAWAELETTIRTGRPGFEVHHGRSLFEAIGADPRLAQHFAGAMGGLSELVAREASASIAPRLEAQGCATFCDVGGGHGYLLEQLGQRLAEVQYILFEQPDVVAALGQAEPAPFAAVAGSFFESVPRADAHMLSNVLHDWGDEDALRILRNVRRAQPDSGRLFLLEMMLGGETEPLLARSTDLNMLVLTGGRERTREEFETLLAKAGFTIVAVGRVADLSCLVEAVPTQPNSRADSKERER
jgi:hypothetical protein